MDIRNFFGPPKITKNTKDVKKDETVSKPEDKHKNSNNNKKKVEVKSPSIEKQTSKEKLKQKTSQESKSESRKTPEKSKNESKNLSKKEEKVIQIDSDEDENGNVSTKKSQTRKKSRDIFSDSDEEKTQKKSIKRKKKQQISSDEEDGEEVIKSTTKKSKKSNKSQRVIESDEEDPLPKLDKKSSKKGNKKSGPVFIDDSDEEKPKKSTLDAFLKTPSPQKVKPKEEVKKQDSSVKKTPVSVTDFFGGGSVKRTERPTVTKRKLEEPTKEEKKTNDFDDVEMHDDEDFVKTLEALDEGRPPKKARLDTTENQKPPSKSDVPGTLASKLAAKAKTLVEDTPEKTSSKKDSVSIPETPVTSMKSPKKELPVKQVKVSPAKLEKTSMEPSPAKPEKTSPKKPSPSASEKASTPKPDKAAQPKVSPNKTSPDTPASMARKGSMYKSYLTREGPQALGSKEIPEQDIPNDESLNMLKDQDQELVTDLKAEYSSSIVRKRARRILSQDSLHLTTHALQKQEMSECLQSSSQELTESSQEISSQGSNWSTDEGVNDLMVYNEAITRLGKGKISPLKYQLGSSISDITSQGKNYIKRKAQQVVNIALDMIAPGQADDLITLITPQNLEPALNGDSIELLKKLYEEATDKTVKEQLLSVMAIIATKDRVIDILGVTKYKVDKVRALTLDALKAKNEAPPKKRQRMDEGKLDHALSFFFDSAFHQLVSYGTREMTLENGEEIIIPDVVRTACHSTMVNMYQSYCQEENFIPLSRSTLFKILRSCSAAKRKNLHGLDNTTADGMKAFSDLEKIATNAYEQGIIDKDLQRNLQSGLLQGKNYLKCQYKFHVFLNSNCADHCIQWALSDPKDNCFHVECAHHHDTQCRQCNFLVETISKFDEIPLAEDEVKDVSVAKLHIANWKGHILRTVNQDRSRIEHIDNLLPNQMFIVMDWAMKFLPQLHREKQSDWFGQKGISWHVAVCMYKTDIEVKHQTMVHILESGKQDWFAVASILEHLLVTIKQQQPQVDQVFLRSDNAGCYHCGQLWSSLHAIGHRTRIQIKDYHFSEAQSGKSYCDAKIAHLHRKIRSYVSEGNDVRLPMEMKAALDSYGGVTGCQVAVVEVNYAKQTLHSHKIKDVLSIANVEVHENSLQFRKGYEIGPGKYLQNISSLVNNTQAETGLKVIKGFDVPKNVAGKINVSNTRDPESNTSELFTCTEEGCVKSFTSFTAYEHHLHCERHTYQLEGLSGFDKIKLRWAESCNNENSRNSVVTSIQESDELDARQVAVNGWALKKERKVIRFKPKVHEYLKEIFKAGEISGKKANPIEVAANMRTLKDDHNIRQFQPEDCLQPSQIVSYFSRLATQAKSSEKKQETVKEVTSHDDDEFLTSLLQDMELQEIRNDVQSKGGENCLEGLTFVITGVLESMERDDAKSLVEKYGGKVTTSLSKKTSYMVVGRDAGESKLNKARSFGTKQIDEDGLLDLIRTRPGKKSKYELQAEESIKKEKAENLKKKSIISEEAAKHLSKFERTPSPKKQPSVKIEESKIKTTLSESSKNETSQSESSMDTSSSDMSEHSLMWVDKYKPTAMKNIIGQTGDKSNAKKLLTWLNSWHSNRAAGAKPSGKFFGKDESGAGFKAALLSGPPGIGKTTTATIVCKEAGFSFVELNASDTRSKKNLQSVVAESLNNTTMVDFTGGQGPKTNGHKHCLVMDEVDGMAGNEDRGGIQELVALIKSTKIPIICMCNDRNHPKMRTLSNYCFDLRFQRPRVEQIKAAMMSIAFKEGVKIPPPALNEIILASNQDIRQVIHNMSMWSASSKTMSYEQTKKDADMAKKDLKIGPFEVCRKVFAGGQETAGMTVNDKSDLFFQDYSFGPLFVQENYIHVVPFAAKGDVGKHLSQLSRAADSLCDGDLVDKCVRGSGQWGLLPIQAIYASVMPGEHMRGSMSQMIQFPQWLGKNSSTGKHDRILQELQTHMRLHVSCDKRGLNMDYLPYMRASLTEPLVRREADGVPDVIQLMDEYDIIKDDFDNIIEVSKWPNSKDPMSKLNPKTKAAFTRTYNKEIHLTPYSTGTVTKKRKGTVAAEEDLYGDGEEAAPPSSDEEEEKIDLDTMIKVKKKENKEAAKKKTADEKKTKAESSKVKGKGRGKGKS